MKKKDNSMGRQPGSSKSLKSGGYSLVMCAVVLVIVVLVNLIVGALPAKVTEPDISANSLFTLSAYSEQIAKGIDTDVTIYLLATGSKDPYVTRLLDRYEALNKHINVEVRDPEVSQIATQYTKEQVSNNSLIFVSEKRSKVVDYASLYSYSDSMSMYYSGQSSPDEFCGEKEITSALSFVTTDVLPKIYALTGHGEFSIGDSLTSAIASENIELNTLDLTTEKEIPEDCACLLLLAPDTDITDKELETILTYLDNGGRLLTAALAVNNRKADEPNYDKLLQNCGVLSEEGFLVEGDRNNFYYSPTYLLPEMASHEITDPLNDSSYHICVPICQHMQADPHVRSTLSVTPLLSTSDDAFARVDAAIETAEKTDGDLDGPFDLAYAVTGEGDGQEMRAVIVASPYFMDEQFTSLAGNVNFLLNSLKWMCELEENISVVDVKSLSSGGSLEVDTAIGSMWMVVMVVILPVAVLSFGVVIYVRRKKR